MRPRRKIFNVLALTVMLGLVGAVSGAARGLSQEDIEALRERGEREGWTFTVGENPATQYDLEELCGLQVPDKWWEGARFDPCTPSKALPSRFDWRDSSGFTPIKNQGDCGSCWAFGTVGPLECNIKIKDGVTTDISEQYLVSCNSDGWDCSGGWWAHDYHEWKTDPCGGTGAVLEADFPYTASDDPCDCPYPHAYLIDNWAFIGTPWTVPPVASIKQAIIDYGPVSVAVYANDAMLAYTGGIFNDCEDIYINHTVTLMGWDDDQGPSGVWFMRNSWGSGWGEKGYMRIPYNCSRIGYHGCYVEYPGSPILRVSLPDGVPDVLVPEESTTVNVEIEEKYGESYVSGSAAMYYRYDGGSYLTSALVHLGGDLYQATLPQATCSDAPEYYFSAEGTLGGVVTNPADAPATVYSTGVGEIDTFMVENLDADPGWTAAGDWAFGQPTGGGGECGGPDPTSGHTGINVYGYNLSGDYPNWMLKQNLTSPAIDCTGKHYVHLHFWRWLGVEDAVYDQVAVRVSNTGAAPWTTVWKNDCQVADTSWVKMDVDISAVADDDTVYLRWTMGWTDDLWTYCGWNIDDIMLTAVECSGGTPPEAIDDLIAELAVDDISLRWTEPYSETGLSHYVVYRGTGPDVSGDSLASTVDTTYTDAGVAGDTGTNYYYTVKAVSGEGLKSEASNQVGEYDSDLINGP